MTKQAPKIEKSVKPPPAPTWGLPKLKKGESIVVSHADIAKVRCSAAKYKLKHPGWDYVTRLVVRGKTLDKNKYRIWRT